MWQKLFVQYYYSWNIHISDIFFTKVSAYYDGCHIPVFFYSHCWMFPSFHIFPDALLSFIMCNKMLKKTFWLHLAAYLDLGLCHSGSFSRDPDTSLPIHFHQLLWGPQGFSKPTKKYDLLGSSSSCNNTSPGRRPRGILPRCRNHLDWLLSLSVSKLDYQA